MARLVPIQHHSLKYPKGIYPGIREVSGNFDSSKKILDKAYLLNTEYSEEARKFDTEIVKKYKTILTSQVDGIPQLWFSEEWTLEFVDFIKDISDERLEPKIIEIHPAFSDYSNLDDFLTKYKLFNKKIKNYFPSVKILLENRARTDYKKGKFIFSNIEDLVKLSEKIDQENLDLRISFDIPNIFEAHRIDLDKGEEIFEILSKVKNIRHNIKSIHIWGKRKASDGKNLSYIGDLDSFFSYDTGLKDRFLKELYEVFNHEIDRYFVPVVNSGNEDLKSIVMDFIDAGFEFI